MKNNNTASTILMPLPYYIIDKEGHLEITSSAGIKCTERFNNVRKIIANQFSFDSKTELIEFIEDKELIKEEYHLDITDTKIVISASSSVGIYHGMQTIRQLMISCDNLIPCCTIKDKPKYSWRGFMVDCARNFVSINELKKLIDIAAADFVLN
jgi:hexosaminidase